MGVLHIVKKSESNRWEWNCRGAPLCSRIATCFEKLLTSNRFHSLYGLPTTSYHFLPPPTTASPPPPFTSTISLPHLPPPSTFLIYLSHLHPSSSTIYLHHPPPSTSPIYLPQLLPTSPSTSPICFLHPHSPSTSTSCITHPPPLKLFA